MRFRTLFATLALLFALPAVAQDTRPPAVPPRAAPAWFAPPPPVPPAPAPAAKSLVTKVFSVQDLVSPSPSLDGEKATAAYRANTEKLVKLVTDMVRPYSWDAAGGAGKAEFFDLGNALVVTNTADAVAEVADLLEALHMLGALSLTYEVRLVRAPVGAFERAGVKPGRDTALTPAQLGAVLEAGQADRDASVTQFPRLTVGNGESATSKCGDTRTFVTGVDATKVKGQNVLVSKETAVHLGETATLKGVVSADRKYVRVEASVAHARLVGNVELVPVVTQITPVFEGGSQGKPVPFTQYVQVPDVRKENVERSAVVPDAGTLVVGSWKQLAEPKGKGKPGQELEVLALVTVRVVFDADVAQKQLVAPPAARANTAYKLRNVAAADAASALATHFKGSGVVVVAEPKENTLLVNADKETSEKVARLIAALDKEPQQVVVQATIAEVPDGFLAKCGLIDDPRADSCVLTPRETQMFNAFLRAAKEKGELDVLSRPQIQVRDGQTGYVQVGQAFPVETAGGKVEHKQLGITMRVTPRFAPDGKSVTLAAETQHASVETTLQPKTLFVPGAVFPITAFTSVPVFNTQAVKSTTAVPFGHTVVTATTEKRVRTSANAEGGRTQEVVRVQTLVILTPQLVAPVAEVKPAAGWFTK